MGVAYNSSIVTSGLTLCLDAANPKNYNLTAVEVLVVAGGGGGSGNFYDDGAGGGAGGLIYSSIHSITPGSAITVTVGAGGAASSGGEGGDGGNSVFGALTAIGGGGGAAHRSAGRAGGSGGGSAGQYGGSDNAVGGNGTAGQGFAGGTATGYSGSGGGGASSIGLPAGIPGWGFGGNGGNGKIYSISGISTYYAGGGGGYGYSASSTTMGGLGGGGNGGNPTPLSPTPGTPNTGGGGGGGRTSGQVPFVGTAAGGSGIVIVRYPGPQKAIGGTVTSVGGDTIHTFITSGTFTPLVATNNSAVLGLSDFSGRNNFATANGLTYATVNEGALSFDGGDASHIQIVNTSGQLDFPGDFTVSLWIYPTQYHRTYQTMIDTYPGGATNGWIFTTMYGGSQVISWYTEGSSWQPSSTAVTLNAWNCLSASRIGTTVKLYKNATEIHSHSDSSNIRGGVGRIGRGLDDANNYGNVFGKISNVQIYKGKGLTAAEVSQNFNALRSRFSI